MTQRKNRQWLALAMICTLAASPMSGGMAADDATIVDSWKSIAVPAPPELQPVTVDSAHTALLVLDMYASWCNEAQRPSCLRSIPHVQQLLKDARAHKMMVVYSGGPPNSTNFTLPPEAIAPLPGEPMVRSNADKFLDTDLAKMLAAGGVQTVIVMGTSADGAVLYTASSAALRGLKAIVPIDGISAAKPFGELTAIWLLKNTSGSVASYVTLTKTGMITLQ